MAQVGPIAGTAFVRVNGQQFQLRGSFRVDPTMETAEYVVGQDGPHGYITKVVAPFFEGEFSDLGGLSIVALQTIRDASVTGELANGKVYVLTSAVFAGRAVLDTVDGKIPFRFEGATCLELTAS
jgi:hypothetical protein